MERRRLQGVDRRQVWAGLTFIGIGAAALLDLPTDIGIASAMGPGYFPLLLGACLILLGLVSIVTGTRAGIAVPMERLPIGTGLSVIAGTVAFALLIRPAGLAPALLALIASSCYRRLRSQPLTVLVIYLALLLLTWFAFIDVIQLPIELVR